MLSSIFAQCCDASTVSGETSPLVHHGHRRRHHPVVVCCRFSLSALYLFVSFVRSFIHCSSLVLHLDRLTESSKSWRNLEVTVRRAAAVASVGALGQRAEAVQARRNGPRVVPSPGSRPSLVHGSYAASANVWPPAATSDTTTVPASRKPSAGGEDFERINSTASAACLYGCLLYRIR